MGCPGGCGQKAHISVPRDEMDPALIASKVDVLYEGSDPPFHIRGPYSRVVYRVRRNEVIVMSEADAGVLRHIEGFRLL